VNLIIHIDGGARGNPGPAGFGVHVAGADGTTIDELYGYLGVQTNNIAEYAALIAALRYAVKAGAGEVTIRSDSELLVRQLLGEYKVRNAGLIPLHREAINLKARIPGFSIEHVRREQNREADALANLAMDARGEAPPGVTAGLPLPATARR
jgi:ribonuclease HI